MYFIGILFGILFVNSVKWVFMRSCFFRERPIGYYLVFYICGFRIPGIRLISVVGVG